MEMNMKTLPRMHSAPALNNNRELLKPFHKQLHTIYFFVGNL